MVSGMIYAPDEQGVTKWYRDPNKNCLSLLLLLIVWLKYVPSTCGYKYTRQKKKRNTHIF